MNSRIQTDQKVEPGAQKLTFVDFYTLHLIYDRGGNTEQ